MNIKRARMNAFENQLCSLGSIEYCREHPNRSDTLEGLKVITHVEAAVCINQRRPKEGSVR